MGGALVRPRPPLLREPDATRQAGFGADQVFRARKGMRPPILYLEGEQHRLQRRAAARFFAPAVIEGYRPMMEELADQLVGRLRADRATDLTSSRCGWRCRSPPG